MSLKSIATVLGSLSFMVNSYEKICEPYVDCKVDDANSSTTVIADNRVPNLIIDCISAGSCKKNGADPGLIVYSSANNTYINCIGEDSCEECDFNFGFGPNGLTGFDAPRDKVTVTCTGKQSCKTITIDSEGELSDGLLIATPASIPGEELVNQGAFMAGIATCSLGSNCTLECGSDPVTCEEAKCFGNCICDGTACPVNYNIPPTNEPTSLPTPKPTTNPVATGGTPGTPGAPGAPIVTPPPPPTNRPTPSPVDPRNTTLCGGSGCLLNGTANTDFICPAGLTQCTVDCSGEAVCSEAVTIAANSDNVDILCPDISSCDSLEVNVDAASTVTIIVSGQKSATNMVVTVNNPLAIVTIVATGQEGFEGSSLTCDGTCTLDCPGQDGCKDVTYKCLTSSANCNLFCDATQNQCATLLNLGDANCVDTPNNCVIVASGDQRIVVPNTVNEVTIVCNNEEQQCKADPGLVIYSGAAVTNLLCDQADACEEVRVLAGTLTGSNVPEGFDASDFAGTNNRTVNANCNANSACKSLILYTEGPVSSVVDGNGEDALYESSSTCNNCNSLEYLCLEFNGCSLATIACSNPSRCSCQSPYEVDIGNATEVLATTQTPRDNCPAITTLIARQKIASMNNANSFISHGTSKTLSIVIPTLIITAVLLVLFGFVMVNYRKYYNKIPGVSSKTDKFMLENSHNENIYATYQVEMQ